MMELSQFAPHFLPLIDGASNGAGAALHSLSQVGLSQAGIAQVGFDWSFNWNLPWSEINSALLAQQFDTDVFSTTRRIVGDFIKTGKLWVLVIGIVIGYVLKSLTTYG
jgi:hypothetical protein